MCLGISLEYILRLVPKRNRYSLDVIASTAVKIFVCEYASHDSVDLVSYQTPQLSQLQRTISSDASHLVLVVVEITLCHRMIKER